MNVPILFQYDATMQYLLQVCGFGFLFLATIGCICLMVFLLRTVMHALMHKTIRQILLNNWKPGEIKRIHAPVCIEETKTYRTREYKLITASVKHARAR